ncbi:MAG: nucleoside deaminase [Coriobacteriia bacterium]|nr:nucleoside deaminase [Coriobacteriia bacterium]MCL2749399.1 nucleoside deaminase [Coriobacteriia bacterium]
MSIDNLRKLNDKLDNISPSSPCEVYALEAVREAISAAESGNFGVGAILVDDQTGEIVCRGNNKVFSRHRSDLHAEMDLLNTFESKHGSKSRELLKGMTLYTSLESCPMCLCRIITSGVARVFHVADDELGGMVHLYRQLPETWQEISANRVFQKADCSPELSELAFKVFLATANLDNQL